MQVIEDSSALFRRCGVSIGFRTLAEEVLSPLQKSGQIRSENLHANRYTLAGSPASAAAAAAAVTDGGAGKARSKGKVVNKKDVASVDEAAWRRALEECLALGSPEARIWRMVGGGCDQPTPLTVEEVGVPDHLVARRTRVVPFTLCDSCLRVCGVVPYYWY